MASNGIRARASRFFRDWTEILFWFHVFVAALFFTVFDFVGFWRLIHLALH